MKKIFVAIFILISISYAQPSAWKTNQKDISPIVIWGDSVRIIEFEVAFVSYDRDLLKIKVAAIGDDSTTVRDEIIDFDLNNRELGALKIADSSFISIIDGAFIKLKQLYNFIQDP